MPLVGSPGTGYPDGQRLANYDSGPLWNFTMVASNQPQTSPVMNMQHFAAAGGYILATVGIATITMTWYADALLVNEISAKTFQVDHNIPAALGGLMIPNLGPFLQITAAAIGGANYAINALIFGSNRISPIPWIPQNGVLIDVQSGAIGANSAVILYPTDYYAGPAFMWAAMGQSSQFTIDVLNSAGAYDVMDQTPITAANTGIRQFTVTPSGAWRVVAANASAVATTYFCIVTPSLTGAT